MTRTPHGLIDPNRVGQVPSRWIQCQPSECGSSPHERRQLTACSLPPTADGADALLFVGISGAISQLVLVGPEALAVRVGLRPSTPAPWRIGEDHWSLPV